MSILWHRCAQTNKQKLRIYSDTMQIPAPTTITLLITIAPFTPKRSVSAEWIVPLFKKTPTAEVKRRGGTEQTILTQSRVEQRCHTGFAVHKQGGGPTYRARRAPAPTASPNKTSSCTPSVPSSPLSEYNSKKKHYESNEADVQQRKQIYVAICYRGSRSHTTLT